MAGQALRPATREAAASRRSRPPFAATAPGTWRVLPVKFAGAVLAIGSGFALGREGPTVHMGATAAEPARARILVPRADDRALIAAGAGAGLAAAFNAPLAGVIFVFEELVRRFGLRTGVAALTACSAGLAIMRAIAGDRPVFGAAGARRPLSRVPVAFLVLGALIGLLGPAYNWMIVAGLRVMDRMERIPGECARRRLSETLVGMLACARPEAIGSGDRQVQSDSRRRPRCAQLTVLLAAARFVLGPLSYAPGFAGRAVRAAAGDRRAGRGAVGSRG